MPFPTGRNPNTQFKPGQSGNPKGKPKGTLSLSTHIQRLMNEEDFEAIIPDGKLTDKEYKGTPMIAIIKTALARAANGDDKARDWLAKYGYGTNVETTSEEINIRFEVVNKVPKPKD